MIGRAIRRALELLRLAAALPFLLVGWLLEPRARDVMAITLRGGVPEEAPSAPRVLRRLLGAPRTSFVEALAALRVARDDDALRAVLLVLDRAELPLAWAEELAASVAEVRAKGRRVFVWLDEPGAGALVVAAAADHASVSPTGQLRFAGIRLRSLFLRGPLARAGLVPELLHVGPWKTASDMFTRRGMTPEHEDMSRWLADDLHAQVTGAIARGRKKSEDEVARAIDDAPVAHETAVARGLADRLLHPDELDELLEKELALGREPVVRSHEVLVARARRRDAIRHALRPPPFVAIVPARGAIFPGDEAGTQRQGCPSRPLVELLDSLREADDVAAVVLRIDSPGGSATASDEIWRAVERLDEERPVVASLGRVAASGGYYIACGARRIVAAASTITGSIGVVTGKLHMEPLLAKLDVGVGVVERGARAGLFSPDRPFTDDERAAVRREMERVYETFLARVASARGKTRDEVHALGQGRVFTGRQALANGLVDELGGLVRAVQLACELAGKPSDRPVAALLKPRPRRSSLLSAVFAADVLPPLPRVLDPLRELAPFVELLDTREVLFLEPTRFEGVISP